MSDFDDFYMVMEERDALRAKLQAAEESLRQADETITAQVRQTSKLQAEVARLTERSHQEIDACCSSEKAQLRTRIAELEAGLRELGKHLHHTIKYPVGHIPVECPACKSVAALLGEGQDA